MQVSAERSGLDIELSENLRRRRDELRGKLDELEADAGSGALQVGEVELRNNELRNLIRSINDLTEQVTCEPTMNTCHYNSDTAASEARVEELIAEIATVSQQLDEVQNEQLENTRAIIRVQKNAERYLTKRQTLVNRRDECTNAIRDLGMLPEEAYNKYKATRADKVCLLSVKIILLG